ncbi:MAG: hypothetical protein E6H84_08020 [Chloroflexi bacterium]|nr:MAG: hypothetical protein E6H84_08020 [Chloroflexota bacterium]TMG69786.1 MAG: hypothetical protein E6H81_09405 [Chloroflexota bacterium]
MFEHLIAAVAKFFFAAGLVAGASGAGNVDLPEWHLPKAPVHTEKTHEPQASPEATKTPERYSFESLLKECVTRYTGHLDGAKDVCTAAIAASGLEADAFWAKYRSLLVKELPKTEPTTSFEALLKECVARYARAASNTKEACDAALRASGLDTDAFWAKYRSLMVPPKTTKTETPKPVTTPKPAPTLSAECMAKYEAVKAAKNGPADAFEALVRSFNESCRTTTDNKSTTTPKPVATPKPAPTVQLSAACVAKYEAAKAAKNGPADVFEALVRAFKDSCLVTTEVKS